MKKTLVFILTIFVLLQVKAQQNISVVHSSIVYSIKDGIGTKLENSITITFKKSGFVVKQLNYDELEFFFTKFIEEREGCYYGEVITKRGEKYYFWISCPDNELTWAIDPKAKNGIQYVFDKPN